MRTEGSHWQARDMPIPEFTLSRWSHDLAGTAFKHAHMPIREALAVYEGLSRSKGTIRIIKAARDRLVDKGALSKEAAPSCFIECLLYNISDSLFAPKLSPTYAHIMDWLKMPHLSDFQCQNGQVPRSGAGGTLVSKKGLTFV